MPAGGLSAPSVVACCCCHAAAAVALGATHECVKHGYVCTCNVLDLSLKNDQLLRYQASLTLRPGICTQPLREELKCCRETEGKKARPRPRNTSPSDPTNGRIREQAASVEVHPFQRGQRARCFGSFNCTYKQRFGARASNPSFPPFPMVERLKRRPPFPISTLTSFQRQLILRGKRRALLLRSRARGPRLSPQPSTVAHTSQQTATASVIFFQGPYHRPPPTPFVSPLLPEMAPALLPPPPPLPLRWW